MAFEKSRRILGIGVVCVSAACSTHAPVGPLTNSGAHAGPSIRFDLTSAIGSTPWPNDALCWLDDSSAGPCLPNLPTATLSPDLAEWVTAIDSRRGWPTTGALVIPFDRAADVAAGPAIDLARLKALHSDDDWTNDALYLMDLATGIPRTLDVSSTRGAFVLQVPIALDASDVRREEPSLTVETVAEGYRGTTAASGSESSARPLYRREWDTDSDAILDLPALLPGNSCPLLDPDTPPPESERVLRDRCLADELVDTYDIASETLRVFPRTPLEESHQYAVVIMDRLVDNDERSVSSPFGEVSHPRQRSEARRALDWLGTSDLARYYGTISEDPFAHAKFIWSFTTGAPSQQLRSLARRNQPDLFRESPEVTTSDAQVELERSYTLDADCVGSSPRGAIASMLREAVGLTATEEAAVLGTLGSVARIAFGTLHRPSYTTPDQAGTSISDTTRVPVWLSIPKSAQAEVPLPVVIVSHDQGSSQLEALRWAGHWAHLGLATIGFDRRGASIAISESSERWLQQQFDQSCVGGMLADFLRQRSDASDAPKRNDTDTNVVLTSLRWREDAIELMALQHALETVSSTSQRYRPTAFVGIGTGAASSALATSLAPDRMSLVLVDPATSPERAWSRAATWGGPERALWHVFGPRFAGVPVATLPASETRCVPTEASIRLFSADTTPSGEEVACMPLVTTDGTRFPEGATVVATNLSSLARRCVAMSSDGKFSLGLPTAAGDTVEVAVYDSMNAVVRFGRDADCDLVSPDIAPRLLFGAGGDTFGSLIVASTYGLGLERQSSELLKTLDLAAAAFAPANPAAFVAELSQPSHPIQSKGILLSLSPGDPIVPPDEGVSLARAARLIPRFPPGSLSINWELADDTTPAIASALAKPTAAARVEWARLEEGAPRLRRFPPSSSTCGSNLTNDLELRPSCPVSSPDLEKCAQSLPDLDALSGPQSVFGAVQPIPSLRLARYAGRPTLSNVMDLWSPQSRVIGPSVQATHPDWPFVAMALPLANPWGSHGMARDDLCQRFRFGTYVANLVGQFIVTGGTDFPPVTSRDTQQCLATPTTCSILNIVE